MPCSGSLRTLSLAALTAGGITGAAALLMNLKLAVDTLTLRVDAATEQLQIAANEVARMRIEQSAEGRGPQALLEKLRAYAPALVSSRTTQPDFEMARQGMESVLRAFTSLGSDGLTAVRSRFDELDPKQAFDEMRWLMEAAVKCNLDKGRQIAVEVLSGLRKPSPRLRWTAADMLLRIDRPLAQRTLRQILLTETSRGVDPNRATAYGLPVIDPSAVAVSGFYNFIIYYLRSEDPDTEDTLLQVLMRTEQDVTTLQETIEALGQRRAARADQRIEDLYLHPPGASQNALFLNKCLDALVAIRGRDGARPFLEEQLVAAEHELVQAHIKYLLQDKTTATAEPVDGGSPVKK